MPAKQAPILPANLIGILPLQDAVLFPHTVIPLAVVKKPGIAAGRGSAARRQADRLDRPQGSRDRGSRSRRHTARRHDRHHSEDAEGSRRHAALHRRGTAGLPDRAVHASLARIWSRPIPSCPTSPSRTKSSSRCSAISAALFQKLLSYLPQAPREMEMEVNEHHRSERAHVLRRLDDASRHRRSPGDPRRAQHGQADAQAHDAAHQGARSRRAGTQDSEPTSSARWRRISASSICASNCARFRKSSAKPIRSKPKPTSCARRSTKPGCRRTSRRRPTASSTVWRKCRRQVPSTASSARTSIGSCSCRGTNRDADQIDIAKARADPRRGSLRSRKDQGPHRRVSGRRQTQEETDRPDPVLRRTARASARRRSDSRSPERWAASSCACRSAACATKPRSAAIAAPTSARCPARSCARCATPGPTIR